MPLGEVLHRLVEGSAADIVWEDATLKKQLTTGSYDGPVADVMRQVLLGTNFMIAYSGKHRVARVIVLGRSGQTALVAPGVVTAPAGNSPPPPTTPRGQVAQPVAPAHVTNPARRSHDM
jgi:hypothetical protein